jgi:hypothetical protein
MVIVAASSLSVHAVWSSLSGRNLEGSGFGVSPGASSAIHHFNFARHRLGSIPNSLGSLAALVGFYRRLVTSSFPFHTLTAHAMDGCFTVSSLV